MIQAIRNFDLSQRLTTNFDQLAQRAVSESQDIKEAKNVKVTFTAATGMYAQQLNLDVISHNLANVNTTGYKKGRAEFQDLLYQNVINPGAPSDDGTQYPTGIQVGLGVETCCSGKIFYTW